MQHFAVKYYVIALRVIYRYHPSTDVGHGILTLNPDRSFDYMPAVDLEEDNRKVI